MNHTVMMGRLVRDPQINYVQNSEGDEVAVANFRLAVDRKFSDETDFFPCSAFGWLAEFAEQYLFQYPARSGNHGQLPVRRCL